jgi:L-cystine transport system permease protein
MVNLKEGYFEWKYVIEYFPQLLTKLPTTLMIVLVATVFGILMGFLIAFIRLERIPVLQDLCKIIVSFIRGTPILIQMFVVYYALPVIFSLFGVNIIRWEKIYFIFITYSINIGGYFSEVFRGAIQSVPKAQTDAALSVGLTKLQAYRCIILPQSVIIASPSVGTTMTGLLQDSSLAFTFGVIDVIGKVNMLGGQTTHILEGYFDAAIIFSVLTILLEKLFSKIEAKTRYQSVIA